MKLKFKISKLANYYFFIANLSQWHFSSRKDYNEEWLKMTGGLTVKESNLLKEFQQISQRYNFSSPSLAKTKYLGKYFYLLPEKICWKELKRHLTAAEYKIINEAFAVFKPRFEKIWSKLQDQRLKIFREEVQKKSMAKFIS